jgi:hypothetical protein
MCMYPNIYYLSLCLYKSFLHINMYTVIQWRCCTLVRGAGGLELCASHCRNSNLTWLIKVGFESSVPVFGGKGGSNLKWHYDGLFVVDLLLWYISSFVMICHVKLLSNIYAIYVWLWEEVEKRERDEKYSKFDILFGIRERKEK